MRGIGASTEGEVLARLKTRGVSSTSSSSSWASSAMNVADSSKIFFSLGLGVEGVEVEVGMVCVWTEVVGGVGTDGGLIDEGFADVGGGSGLVCVLVGIVWVFVCGSVVWACV